MVFVSTWCLGAGESEFHESVSTCPLGQGTQVSGVREYLVS